MVQRQKDSLIQAILEHFPEQIYIKDLDGRHILVSREVDLMYAAPGGTIVGKFSHDIFPQESADEHTRHDQEVIQTRDVVTKEYAIPYEDGSGIHRFLSIKFPIFGGKDKDKVIYIGALTADITHNKEIEEELRQAKEEAETANHAKSRFLANTSHEIRTPLSIILGMTELLEQTNLNEKQRRHLQVIREAGDGLLVLINHILDLSKIEAGELFLEDIRFDLKEVLDGVINVSQQRAKQKNLVLQGFIASDVSLHRQGDRFRLQQVLTNLIGNAIKFSERGEITVHVKNDPALTKPANSLLFSVSDTGIGIPSDQQEKIFEGFTQEDVSTTRKYGGTGLGLSISRQIVEMMGGKIWVESEVGNGSTFSFTMILEEVQPVSHTQSDDMIGLGDNVSPLNILFAENDALMRHIMLEFLSDFHQVSTVENGLEAVEAFKKREFDIVLMDIQMPIKDGNTATSEIRAWEKEKCLDPTPIIALSANVMKQDVENCLAAGCSMYLGKPVHREKLLQMVNDLVKERSELTNFH